MITLDVVNAQNETVGSLQLSDAVFGDRVNTHVIWEAVVHENASARRGTHATKTRGRVSGSGRKPWRQKGTGRAQVGEIRNALWRKGGTVFGPQPRSYGYALPRKVTRGGLRAAIGAKIKDAELVVVDRLTLEEGKTKAAAELLRRLGISGKVVIVDVVPDEQLARAARNLEGVCVRDTVRLTTRDVVHASRVIATPAAIERLQAALGTASRKQSSG